MAVVLKVNSKVLSGIGLAIFDKDGTLIDVHVYWANMVRFRAKSICEKLGLGKKERESLMNSMGVDVETMNIKPEGPVGLKKREIVLQAGVNYLSTLGFEDHTELLLQIFQEVDHCSLERFDEIIKPIDGLYPLFDTLKENGCKIAIATTDRRDRAELAMKHLGVLEAVDFIAGADMIKKPKPSSEIIDLICERVGVDVENSIMVGDSKADVQTGLNAGCMASIGVESGLTQRNKLLAVTSLVVPDISAITVKPQQ